MADQFYDEQQVRLQEATRSFQKDFKGLQEQNQRAADAARAAQRTSEAVAPRLKENLREMVEADEMIETGVRQAAQAFDKQNQAIEAEFGPAAINAILGNRVQDALKDFAAADANLDSTLGAAKTKTDRRGRVVRENQGAVNLAVDELQGQAARATGLLTIVQQANVVASQQTQNAKNFQPTAKPDVQVDGERLKRQAALDQQIIKVDVDLKEMAAQREIEIAKLKNNELGSYDSYFRGLAQLHEAKRAGQNERLLELEIRQREAALQEHFQSPELVKKLESSGFALEDIKTFSSGDMLAAHNFINGLPMVRDITDMKQVDSAKRVIMAKSGNPVHREIATRTFSALQGLTTEEGVMVRDTTSDDPTKKILNPEAFYDKAAHVFDSTAYIESIEGGQKVNKTPVQAVGQAYLFQPGGVGQFAYLNKYADNFAASGRPGADLMREMQARIKNKGPDGMPILGPTTETNIGYWRAIAEQAKKEGKIGDISAEIFGFYQHMREQVLLAMPYREFGLPEPQAQIPIPYQVQGLFGPEIKVAAPKNKEEMARILIQIDASEKLAKIRAANPAQPFEFRGP